MKAGKNRIEKITLNVGLHPTGFARDAWNVLKLMRAYAAKKKFEIKGAIAFSSPKTRDSVTSCS